MIGYTDYNLIIAELTETYAWIDGNAFTKLW